MATEPRTTRTGNPLWPPVLLAHQPRALQIVLPIVGPVATGALCGWLLGVSEIGYTIATIALILGGIAAGYEHDTSPGGALRGLCGGVLFGASIAITHAIIGADEQATVPHPVILLALVFGVIGAGLGVAGAALRRRSNRRKAQVP